MCTYNNKATKKKVKKEFEKKHLKEAFGNA